MILNANEMRKLYSSTDLDECLKTVNLQNTLFQLIKKIGYDAAFYNKSYVEILLNVGARSEAITVDTAQKLIPHLNELGYKTKIDDQDEFKYLIIEW